MNEKNIFSNIKSEFPFFEKNQDLIYFDSAATSLKPKVVIEAVNNYYQNYSANPHTIDFSLAVTTGEIYEQCRQDVANFIHAQKKEVVFCPSTTFALNQIAYSLGKYLTEGDEIVLTTFEHGSLLLPFYRLVKEKKVVLKFIEVDSEGLITNENLKKALSKKTRIVAFASMNNSVGTINNVKELTQVVKNFEIEKKSLDEWPFEKALVLVDGAQSVAHITTDVSDWNIDFFAFSGHKLFGPTGIAVWWGKAQWISLMEPLLLGGGMNSNLSKDGNFTLINPPESFEGGTPNVAGVFGLQAAIKYVTEIGVENIHQYEKELKTYAVEQFKKHLVNKVVLYNEKQESGILLFSVPNVASEDVATYLDSKKIALRSGTFCARLISEAIKCDSSLRASLSIYNTKSDIDYLISTLQKAFENGGDFLDEFFN